ncbi:hypothetical protein [Aeromicrobium sp. Leaf291]|uniref:hypothetical protein n=1 Tax=Aeromicrobium sp. Leaf291 TaxID=1736325 RepID=UPI0006FEB59C|nr:hypothetical protein [Aeromicrobium sp. Leaf291]KQP81600.1 hypothetical protein ASF35_16345 [Aeromicrobium sp. Leaf291]
MNNAPTATAQVLLKDPTYRVADEDATRFIPAGMDWSDVALLEAGDCEHGETICSACIAEWAIDHHVRLIVAGIVLPYGDVPPAG